jgi:hypothetical protein
MGTYDAQEFLDTFGGLPEPGEAAPDLDAIRDRRDDERMTLSAQERVADAFRQWVEDTDPPPVGLDLAGWVNIARRANVTSEELNAVGRAHWGEHWPSPPRAAGSGPDHGSSTGDERPMPSSRNHTQGDHT